MVRRDKSTQFPLLLSLLQVITNHICCIVVYLFEHLCQCIPLTEIWYTMCYQANNNCSKIKLSVHFARQASIVSVGTWPSLHNPCIQTHRSSVSGAIFKQSIFNCSLTPSVQAQNTSQSHHINPEVSVFEQGHIHWLLHRTAACLLPNEKHSNFKTTASLILDKENYFAITCITALNQQVFPIFFIPTGQSPALLQSFCLGFSPQTSQRFLLERFLFSAEWASCALSQEINTVL